jgi:hypothetical protein
LDDVLAAYRRHFDGWLFDRLSVIVTRSIMAKAITSDD